LYRRLFHGWVAAVLAFSLIPLSLEWNAPYENKFVRGDYIFHFLIFFLGCLLCALRARAGESRRPFSQPAVLLACVLVLALLTEALQLLVPSRTFNWFDVLANYSGIAFGLLMAPLAGEHFFQVPHKAKKRLQGIIHGR